MEKASKHKLKDTSFIFPMTNVTISCVFRTHAQKEYGKILEMKSTYILNILALFSTFAMHYSKSGLNGTSIKALNERWEYKHTGQCKSTGGCYNELVVAYFGTGGGVKWRKR